MKLNTSLIQGSIPNPVKTGWGRVDSGPSGIINDF